MLNNEAGTIVRLLAFPVSKEVADNRRRKAKNESRKDPTQEYLESLCWSVYITTITDERIDYTFIYKAYGLRWRIEIIFKCWKSNMGFDKIHNVSRVQLKVLLVEEINNDHKNPKGHIKALAKFCTYDKRKRPNHWQKMEALFS